MYLNDVDRFVHPSLLEIDELIRFVIVAPDFCCLSKTIDGFIRIDVVLK